MSKTPDTPIPAWASVKAYEMANNDTNVFEYPSDHPLVKEIARLLAAERVLQDLQTALHGGENAWPLGTRVTKVSGAAWTGLVVGFYGTTLTLEGYVVESETEKGSVQLYPRKALKLATVAPPVNPATTFTHLRDAEGYKIPVEFVSGPDKRGIYRWLVLGTHRVTKGTKGGRFGGDGQYCLSHADGTCPQYPAIHLIRKDTE